MSFARTFLNFASPALCGIKPANLFSLRKAVFERGKGQLMAWAREFSAQGKEFAVITRGDVCLIFVYDVKLLEEALFSLPSVRLYLFKKGYPKSTRLSDFLGELFVRLSYSRAFPNEIGLFLGYPLEDVAGFERHSGAGSKYSGIWQVYGNVETACKKMQLYKTCSATCCKMLSCEKNVLQVCRRCKAELLQNGEVAL